MTDKPDQTRLKTKKYIRNIPGETFDEWTEEEYEEFLYES